MTVRSRYEIGDELEVTIESIAPGGFGLARGPHGIVFVTLAVAGDRLQIRIYKLKGTVAFAEIVKVLEPGAARETPLCPYFGSCGGCDFQQMTYSAQLVAKADIVRDCFVRIGKLESIQNLKVVGSPNPLGGRTRVEFQIDPGERTVGFYQRQSKSVQPIERCVAADERINNLLPEVRRRVEAYAIGEVPSTVKVLSLGDHVSAVANSDFPNADSFWVRVGNFDYRVNAHCFFQSSEALLNTLVADVIGGLEARDSSRRWFGLDLYSGIGLFSLPLADRLKGLIAIDSDRHAIDLARQSAARAGLSNVKLVVSDVGDWLMKHGNRLKKIDFVVVDPPRSGLDSGVVRSLMKIRPERVVYVSCEPATLARDLSAMTATEYEIESVKLFDLFPQTHHVESIVHLTRIKRF